MVLEEVACSVNCRDDSALEFSPSFLYGTSTRGKDIGLALPCVAIYIGSLKRQAKTFLADNDIDGCSGLLEFTSRDVGLGMLQWVSLASRVSATETMS